MNSNTTKASASSVSEAQLIIDLTQTDLPTKTPVYIYVVGLVSGTSDTYYYLDNDFKPQIMVKSDNKQKINTFPGMSQLSTEAQKAIVPSYPSRWADWSIPVKVKESLKLNLGAINTTNIPTLGTGTSAFSGRIYISVGVPKLPFTVQTGGYTAPVFGGLFGMAGSLTQYDWIEFSYDSLGNFNGNTTQVNQFGFPLMLTGTSDKGQTYHTQGKLNTNGNAILSAIAAANSPLGGASVMTPVPAGCTAAYPIGTNYLRAISPDTASGNSSSPLNTYFDANIKTAYKAWQSTPLVTHDPSSGAYTGVVFPIMSPAVTQSAPANYPTGSLAFYKGNYPTLVKLVAALQSSNKKPAFFLTGGGKSTPTQNKISSNDIWQCANSLASGGTAQKNVGKMIAAAFNRGVMVAPDGTVTYYLNDGTCCATPTSTFYPTGGTFNAWADAFHGYNSNGLAYGFPYDDVCNQNPSIPPSGDTLVASSIRIALGTFGIEMTNPVNIIIDLDHTSGNVAGHIVCTTNAGFTQKANVTIKDSKGDVIAQGAFKGKGEKNTPIPFEGGGTVLSFANASLPLTLNVSCSYDPNGNGNFQLNAPDKVIANQLFDTSTAECYQITSEDWIDNDFNDLILTAIVLKH